MKRHESLLALSRDHHFALRYARCLQNYRDAPPSWIQNHWPAIRASLASYWYGALEAHFHAEDRHLPWQVLPAGEHERLRREHTAITAQWAALLQGPGEAHGLVILGRMLSQHIRWEEQSLFPSLETPASGDALMQAAVHFEKLPAEQPAWLPPAP